MSKKNSSKRPTADPTDFPKAEFLFLPRVANLYATDKAEAEAAYAKLAGLVFKYVVKLEREGAVDDLCTHLVRRDRSAAILDMNAYQLALQLAMPGKFPPLNVSMRKALGIKLAYAKKHDVAPEEVADFIKKLPPMKEMKAELGLTSPKEASTLRRRPNSSPRRPQILPKRRPPPHPMARSSAAKLMKANRRKNARLRRPTADE